MSFFIVTGKLGSGKTLLCVKLIRDFLISGRRIATNLDLNPEYLLPINNDSADCYRIPDIPNRDDLLKLGLGSTKFADESKFGAIVLDEASGIFNSREWTDKGREGLIDFLKHTRKLRWHVYLIVQSIDMLDKQIRASFAEHLITCRRLDRAGIPLLSSLFRLFDINLRPPRIHIATVRYGTSHNSLVVDRFYTMGNSLFDAYNTEQVFDVMNKPFFKLKTPFEIYANLSVKQRVSIAVKATFLSVFASSLLTGFIVGYLVFKPPEKPLEFQTFKPKPIESTLQAFTVFSSAGNLLGRAVFSDGTTREVSRWTETQFSYSFVIDNKPYSIQK
ncbi:MAG: hypothetical protein ORN54_00325 [Cyclobacteriaceae bacterium]|nr:hypothetical protein [Cyclobacteriaceae bacterium]